MVAVARSASSGVKVLWTTPPGDLGQARDTADPLGFRAAATRVARRLVPVLTQTSFRVRGFSLTCFGLEAAHRQPALTDGAIDQSFLRFEHLVVYAQCRWHPDGMPNNLGYSGVRRAFRNLKNLGPELDLNKNLLLHDDLSGGLWGAYRRPAIQLGLLQERWTRSTPSATTVLPLGKALARTLDGRAISDPAAVRKLARDPLRLTDSERTAYLIAEDTGFAPEEEAAGLSRALTEYDDRRVERGRGRRFGALRSDYDKAGHLSVESVDGSLLTEGQAQALEEARALVAIMNAVERPYRLWVTGNRATLAKSVLNDSAWALVATVAEPDLQALRSDLQHDPTFDAVHRHQARLATARGRESWEREDPRPGRDEFEPPDFTLRTMASLFTEGVEPRRPGR